MAQYKCVFLEMVIILKNIGILLWRIWFYVLIGICILLLFPLLFISILKKSWYPFFFKIARVWATLILFGMGFIPKVSREQRTKKGMSYMFVANHTSMIDIMLMFYVVKNPFVFVGKKELAKIPLFGFFYKRTCILVDRNDAESKRNVFAAAQNRLDKGLSVCIFPEGGVPDEKIILDTFKDGAFRLAIEYQIPIVPITFYDNKKRFSYTFFSGSPGILRVKTHPFVETKGKTLKEKKVVKELVREVILKELSQ